jgi:hypothetical protein
MSGATAAPWHAALLAGALCLALLPASLVAAAGTINLTFVSETQVNSGSGGSAGALGNTSPSITPMPGGGFIVAWHDGSPTSCWALVYANDGTPTGSQFSLNPNTPPAWKYGPVVVPLTVGGIMSIWGYSYTPMLIQQFDSLFQPVRGTLPLDLSGDGNEDYGWPAAAVLANGNIVVMGADSDYSNPVMTIIYDASLNPVAPAEQVSINAPGLGLSTAVAASASGTYTPAWWNSTGNIIARSFDVNGNPLTPEFTVNSSVGGARQNPSLAYDSNNNLWIAWESTQSGNSDIYLRTFGPDGSALGPEVLVNQYTAGSQTLAQLAIGSDDTVAVSWTSLDDSGEGVSARIFNSDGNPATAEFEVNQYQSGDQYTGWAGGRRGTVVSAGLYIFTWLGEGAQGNGVYMTIFSALAAPVLVAPANGATNVTFASSLNWSAATGATSYDVYFGTSPTPPLVTNTTATSYTPPSLNGNTTYYWQIAALNAGGANPSAVWSFTTGAPISPAPGTVLSDSLADFSWNSVSGATEYQLAVGTTPGGTNIFAGTTTGTSQIVGYIPCADKVGGTIYVQLAAEVNGSFQPPVDYTYKCKAGLGDFNGDGYQDVIWQNDSTHQVTVHYFDGAEGVTYTGFNWLNSTGEPSGWVLVGAADFDGNGVPDLVWEYMPTGQVTVNYYGGSGGATNLGWNWLNSAGHPGWTVVAVADMDGDGAPDLIWENNTTNQVTVNYYGGTGGATLTGWNWLNSSGEPAGWHVVAAADFDGNGTPDLVWQNTATRQVTVNYYGGAGGAKYQGWNWLNESGDPGWTVVGANDFNGDGVPDLVWQNNTTAQVTVNYYGGAGGATLTGWNWLAATGYPGWTAVVPR